MPDREIATVGWGSLNSHAALYGTTLTWETSGEVHLVNALMPSGTTIQEWYSFADYQSIRDTPTLPLLHHGVTYRLAPVVESSPSGTLIFELHYFDEFNDLLGRQVLYPPAYSFEYPLACHHYTIRLLNGGCDELRFASFTLWEVEEDG